MAAPVSRTKRCRRRGTCALPQTLGPLRIKQAVALRTIFGTLNAEGFRQWPLRGRASCPADCRG
jgi:hypothetical protein